MCIHANPGIWIISLILQDFGFFCRTVLHGSASGENINSLRLILSQMFNASSTKLCYYSNSIMVATCFLTPWAMAFHLVTHWYSSDPLTLILLQ